MTARRAYRRTSDTAFSRPVPVRESEWRQRAACRDTEPEIFFSETEPGAVRARTICSACPVRPQCLAFALAADAWGVWAGTTRDQRTAMAATA